MISLIDKFPYSVRFKNKLVTEMLSYIESYGESDSIKIDFAEKIINDSFKLDSGLSNEAWSINFNLLDLKYILMR